MDLEKKYCNRTIGILLFMMSCLSPETLEAQCAMCRAVLESEPGGEKAKGINNGILYLMTIPYILVGAVVFFIYRSFRKEA